QLDGAHVAQEENRGHRRPDADHRRKREVERRRVTRRDPLQQLLAQAHARTRARIASATPPRMAAAAPPMRPVTASPRTITAPAAGITGAARCTVAAGGA